jgi:VanZ family protein
MHWKPFVPAMIWLAIITWLSVTPGVQMPKFNLISADKLAHAAAYGLLAGLLIRAVRRARQRAISRAGMWGIFGFSTAYGALMEWVQGTFFPGRFFEYDDMLANAAGAFLALIFVHLKWVAD